MTEKMKNFITYISNTLILTFIGILLWSPAKFVVVFQAENEMTLQNQQTNE